MTAKQLSLELREGESEFLDHRRSIIMLALAAASSMALIALYQIGIIKHLPEPPWPGLDADKVDASEDAYSVLRTPDAFLGFGSYAATMGLAAMAGKERAKEAPLIPLALLVKVTFDAAQAVRLTIEQPVKQKAFCLWCLVAAAATFASVPLAVPEALAAWKELRR